MAEDSQLGPAAARPIRNMRITFWGVQGSCPIFPTPYGVQEYSRRLAIYTLGKVFEDMQRKATGAGCSVEDILGGPLTPRNIETYQRRIGLPDLPFYGGETTCVEVETAEGNKLIFDAGSGIRRCSMEIARAWQDRPDRTLHLFGTHEHLDHRSGLSFARFCYIARNPFTVHIYGPYQFLHALDQHYGLFSHHLSDATYIDDPVDYTMMPARFIPAELRPTQDSSVPNQHYWPVLNMADPIRIGSTTVTAFEVYHATTHCLAYQVTHNGRRFVFCTDHELRRGDEDNAAQQRSSTAEARLREYCHHADLAYFDGQYYLDEYLGRKGIGSTPPIKRLDWGHSCVEDIIDRAVQCNIQRTLVGHHDPERTWPERVEMDRHLVELSRGKPNQIQLADSDMVIDL